MFKITFIGGECKGKGGVFRAEMRSLLWGGGRKSEIGGRGSINPGYRSMNCMDVWTYGCMAVW